MQRNGEAIVKSTLLCILDREKHLHARSGGVLGTGFLGALLGVAAKTLTGHVLMLRIEKRKLELAKTERDSERAIDAREYTKRHYYAPLALSLERILNRLQIALADLGANYGCEHSYVNESFAYEFAARAIGWTDLTMPESCRCFGRRSRGSRQKRADRYHRDSRV